MSNIAALNDIKKTRMERMKQLEMLIDQRTRRDVYVSRNLNRKIHKLEAELHQMTIQHRDEIKKCYSGLKTTPK